MVVLILASVERTRDVIRTKLIIVEGLPGSGKTTTASAIHEVVKNNNISSELFLEGNLDHPADFDGVACFSPIEWKQLLSTSQNGSPSFQWTEKRRPRPFSLQEINESKQRRFLEELFEIFLNETFMSCHLSSTPTIGMIKWGEEDERLIEYVLGLEKIIHKLNPVLLYVQQDDIEGSFRKAFDERPADWAAGFVEYYINQGYGERHQHTGINGTLEVLKERQKLEMQIYERLSIQKSMINNSLYDLPSSRAQIIDN